MPAPLIPAPQARWRAPLRKLARRLQALRPTRLVVGLTGGIGSGKTLATDRLEQLGARIVDADLASRRVVEPGTPALREIAARHGEAVLQGDGTLDRRALRKIVFADQAELQWLNRTTHPRIGEEIRRQLAEPRGPYAVLASPLLFEAGQGANCHLTVAVQAPLEERRARAARRDDTTAEAIQAVIDTQMPDRERTASADLLLHNDGSAETFLERVGHLHQAMLWLDAEMRGETA